MFMRLIRGIFGAIADRVPNTVFYSQSLATSVNGRLRKFSTACPEGSPTKAAIVSLACALGETLKPGDELSSTLHGVTNRGRDIGDYEVIIRRKA